MDLRELREKRDMLRERLDEVENPKAVAEIQRELDSVVELIRAYEGNGRE